METNGGIQASLSGRYAVALFDLARDANALDTVAHEAMSDGQPAQLRCQLHTPSSVWLGG